MILSTSHFARVALLLFVCIALCNRLNAQGTWVPVTSTAPHYNAGVMLLLTDGTVMCKTSSGSGTQGSVWDKLTPNASGSYRNGTWTTLASMADDRLYFSSQVLKDGRVYVAGGEYGSGGSSAEVYDPLTDIWTPCPALSGGEFISDANSEMLPDGRVIQGIVGSGSRRIYFYDPVTNTFTTGPTALGSHNESAWAKLPDNSILYVDIFSTNSERYIPATNTWITDASVPVGLYDAFGREMGGAFHLPDGRIFFIGGYGDNAFYTPSGSTANGIWTAGPPTPGSQAAPDAAGAVMVDGKVLFAVSPLPTAADHFPPPTAYYEFDYVSNTIYPVGAPGGGVLTPNPCYYSNMLALPDGTILFANQGDDQYYQYIPSGTPVAVGKPTIAGVTKVDCDTFMATGTLFNGISVGAGFGDDWQMNTNYPIVRLTSGTNVYYARTTNWNSTGVSRGTQADTTNFVLPAGLPAGTYSMQVVANGIASDPVTINTGLTISPSSGSLCVGETITLGGSWTGGSWSSANSSIASVNPVTGEVLGVAGGITNITYHVGACYAVAGITVNALPAPITPSGPISICVSGTLALTDVTPSGIWGSGSTVVATVGPSSGIVSGASAGVVDISYTVGACSSVKTITVSAAPGAVITPVGSTTLCSGGSVGLNANTGAGYTYQWRIGTAPIAGATNFSYTASSGGSFSVIVTNPTGCSSTSAAVPVIIGTPPPAVITPAGPTTFCSGGSVVLNASSGSGFTYQWQLGSVNITGATNISYTASAGGSYTVIVANAAGCNATSFATVVTVNPGPGATITPAGPTTFCAPGSVVLNANTGVGITYQWQAGSVNIPGATASSYSAALGGSYTVIVSLGACVVTSPPVVVTVNSASAGSISGPSSVCLGQTISLSSTAPGGIWTSSNTAIATVSSTSGLVSGIALGGAVITYTVSNVCGTSFTTSAITVILGSTVASVTGASSVCPGGFTTLSDATPGGVWSSSNPAVASISPSGLVSGLTVGATTISYTVSISGCPSVATHTITVSSSFTPAIVPAGTTTFCAGGYVLLNGAMSGATSYQWKKNGVNITGAISSSYTANTAGNYTLFVTVAGGCNGLSAIVPVTVLPGSIVVPLVSTAASAGPVFCLAPSFSTFTASATHGGTPSYQWYVNGAVVGSGPSYGYTPAAGDIVRVVLTSSDACAFPLTAAHSDTISISPVRTPAVSISSTTAVCAGDTVTFSAAPVYGGSAPSFTWNQNGLNVAAGATYKYVPANGDVLICTMGSSFPCVTATSAASSALVVHVQPLVAHTVSVMVNHMSLTAGSLDTFIAIAPNGGTAPTFQWLINSVPVPGETAAVFVTSSLTDGQTVSCQVTSNHPCARPHIKTSAGIRITVVASSVKQMTSGGGSFTLMPNPSKGEFTIEGTMKSPADEHVKIVITNMLGQAVFTRNATAQNGQLKERIVLDQSIANGMYLVSITSGAEHVVYDVVVNR